MKMPSSRIALVVGLSVAALGLSACGDDGNLKVERATAKVASEKRAVAAAEKDLAAATAAFCGDAKTYITAVDRYGDVLHATETTVGDVKVAGKDLADPREEAIAGAETAAAAQQALFEAEQDVAEAEADLATAKGSPAPSPTASPTASPSASPLVPSATLQGVKQAETDFATARQAVNDDTPLAQAAEHFNAAAVQLEMAWLKLFADGGCLGEDQERAEQAVSDYATALQQSLKQAGYFDGDITGVYGSGTVAAVEDLQKAHGLPVTGTVDKATADALASDLAAKGGLEARETTVHTTAVQQTLALVGYWDGPIDGKWTPALTDALKKLQKDLGVEQTGAVDAATVSALEKAIEEAKATPTPSPTPTATPTPSPTETTSPSPSAS